MKRLLLAAGLLAAVAAGPVAGWAGTVQVSSSNPVIDACVADDVAAQLARHPDSSISFRSEVEPWVEVNPTDGDNIVGGWQQDRWSNGGSRSLVAGVSMDGGATWAQVVIPKVSLCSGGTPQNGGDFQRATDPWLTFAPNGDAYFFTLSLDIDTPPGRAGGFGKNALFVSKSTDGGLTWGDPIKLIEDDNPRFLNDKNAITADPHDSRFVYAVWDRLKNALGTVINPENVVGLGFKGPIYFSRTTDGGHSWEPARSIYEPPANSQTIGNQIAVLPDGTLLNVFTEIFGARTLPGGFRSVFNISLIRSADRGETWGPSPHAIHAAEMVRRGVTDPDTGDPVRTGDINPEIAVDRQNGNVYVVWQDSRFTGRPAIALSVSRDGGLTWTAPVKINRTPTNINVGNQQAFNPAIRVADDGTVGVLYYDFRNNTPGTSTLPTDVFLVRFQVDGDGRVVPASVTEDRLTDPSFDMRKAPIARGFFLGDYAGLGVDGDSFKAFFSVTTGTDPANVVFTSVGP